LEFLVRTFVSALVAALLLTVLSAAQPAHAADPNPVTPGDFRGYGFDQCLAPTQKAMDVWLEHSPFLAVGIYISGNSRACRSQPNLTKGWVRRQLANGWRLLPLTLGPQASCATRYPKYDDDPTINPKPGRNGGYSLARKQAKAEANKTVEAAAKLGIVPGSTLWYDLEGFDVKNTHCRESALYFLSAYTKKMHRLGYVSGVYSSVGSGILMLDDARVERPGAFTLPDRIWLARWDGVPNTSSDYIRDDGWRPGNRMKQYIGGHNETHGGVTINIDSNFIDLGDGGTAPPERHCNGVRVDFRDYPKLAPQDGQQEAATKAEGKRISALKCLLREKGLYAGSKRGRYNDALIDAMHAWQERTGAKVKDVWGRSNWVTLFAAPPASGNPVLKVGSLGPDVRRLQRALNAASENARLPVNGVFDGFVYRTLVSYQGRNKLTSHGNAGAQTWPELMRGNR
jgi:hypothetical protein